MKKSVETNPYGKHAIIKEQIEQHFRQKSTPIQTPARKEENQAMKRHLHDRLQK